jgi:hypothetical protein
MKFRVPISRSQKQLATMSPLPFLVQEFFRWASGMALTLAVFAVIRPPGIGPSVFEGHPWQRIYFISVWAAFMSLWRLWRVRRDNHSQAIAKGHVSGPAI